MRKPPKSLKIFKRETRGANFEGGVRGGSAATPPLHGGHRRGGGRRRGRRRSRGRRGGRRRGRGRRRS